MRGYWREGQESSGFSFTAAVLLTITIAAGSIGLAVSASGGVSAVRSPGQTHSARNCSQSGQCTEAEVKTGDLRSIEARLARKGLQVNGRLQHDGAHCSEHSYGAVSKFFRKQPCADLHRAQLQCRDRKGDVVLVAISWVRMAGQQSATSYKTLVDEYGTGNVTELSREDGRYRTVRYTARTYRSVQRNNVVVNAQAEPVARGWVGLALTTIVDEAVR
ncbi:hypothetical protein [Frankia canadensis]|uniref:hypothetical protein n=1 Tax=Frankia canadensis TaxID=1836972 RepID=UPI00105522E2|nr:hypothetical protein [Frankia canadensis]